MTREWNKLCHPPLVWITNYSQTDGRRWCAPLPVFFLPALQKFVQHLRYTLAGGGEQTPVTNWWFWCGFNCVLWIHHKASKPHSRSQIAKWAKTNGVALQTCLCRGWLPCLRLYSADGGEVFAWNVAPGAVPVTDPLKDFHPDTGCSAVCFQCSGSHIRIPL